MSFSLFLLWVVSSLPVFFFFSCIQSDIKSNLCIFHSSQIFQFYFYIFELDFPYISLSIFNIFNLCLVLKYMEYSFNNYFNILDIFVYKFCYFWVCFDYLFFLLNICYIFLSLCMLGDFLWYVRHCKLYLIGS